MEQNVDDIFFDIIPDLPTPEKIIFPLHFIIAFTILSKSLLIDFFYGKKILNLLDGYLIKTEFYERILRVDSSIYHHGLKPNVNYKNIRGFEGKFTFCTNNYGFRDRCNNKIIKKA